MYFHQELTVRGRPKKTSAVRGRGFVQCEHFADKEVFSCGVIAVVCTFWCKKTSIFEIYGVSARTRVVEPIAVGDKAVWRKGGGRTKFARIL